VPAPVANPEGKRTWTRSSTPGVALQRVPEENELHAPVLHALKHGARLPAGVSNDEVSRLDGVTTQTALADLQPDEDHDHQHTHHRDRDDLATKRVDHLLEDGDLSAGSERVFGHVLSPLSAVAGQSAARPGSELWRRRHGAATA